MSRVVSPTSAFSGSNLAQCLRGVLLVFAGGWTAGCGGGGGAQDNTERTMTFGRVVTRIVGAAQPSVTQSSFGAVITGISGATVNGLVLTDGAPDLSSTDIAFKTVGENGISFVNPDGGDLLTLPMPAVYNDEPTWSPDGSRLMFVSQRDGNNNIYSMNADGSGVLQLTSGSSNNAPDWSADGTKVAFQSGRDGHQEIYKMSANGSSQTRLTNTAVHSFGPAWSPDGTRILFTRATTSTTDDIFVMTSTGTQQTQLTNNTARNRDPQFSPDGSKIAFWSTRDGNAEVYIMDTNGSNQTRLTTGSTTSDASPTWSPDGQKIVFGRFYSDSSTYEIRTMNPDGSGQRFVTTGGRSPVWSPFFLPRTLLGTNGTMGTAGAGFLFSRHGDVVASFVTFDATTRADARITAVTGQSSNPPNLVFEVSASDSLTSLSYINSLTRAPIKVIGSGGNVSSATNALVDFNAGNGRVTTVLPYAANRSASKPMITTIGKTTVYRGTFKGVWDADGKNRAPSGAREVLVDEGTGAIVSVK